MHGLSQYWTVLGLRGCLQRYVQSSRTFMSAKCRPRTEAGFVLVFVLCSLIAAINSQSPLIIDRKVDCGNNPLNFLLGSLGELHFTVWTEDRLQNLILNFPNKFPVLRRDFIRYRTCIHTNELFFRKRRWSPVSIKHPDSRIWHLLIKQSNKQGNKRSIEQASKRASNHLLSNESSKRKALKERLSRRSAWIPKNENSTGKTSLETVPDNVEWGSKTPQDQWGFATGWPECIQP